jgi:preprotein translocase subunit SecE
VARNRKRARDRRAGPPEDGSGLATARGQDVNGNPDPLEHATPDAELAEAQLALGRPELSHTAQEAEELEEELEEEAEASTRALAAPAGRAPERHVPGNRLINFLQGSWRELQRVQWPDRRQVMQATGVVLGFVIVAGVFLGGADYVASKIVNLILK